jgi:hypothetical protein
MKGPAQPERVVSLNVRIPESLRKEIRLYALQRDMPLADLVVKAFAALKEKEKKAN